MNIIERIKRKKEILDKAREKQELLYKRNIVYRFYEQSLKISKVSTGMVYMILPDEVLVMDSDNEQSHKEVCEFLLSRKYNKDVNLDSDKDFGSIVARDYDTILIRMVAIINNVSIISYPEHVNDFQLEELKKFKKMLDEYNNSHKESEKAEVIFYDREGKESSNLEELIQILEDNKKVL